MGRAIVYCSKCGVVINGEDIEKGRAVVIGNKYYCRKCVPHDAKGLSLIGSSRVALKQPARYQYQTGVKTGGVLKEFSPGVKLASYAAGGVVLILVLLVLIVILFFSRNSYIQVVPAASVAIKTYNEILEYKMNYPDDVDGLLSKIASSKSLFEKTEYASKIAKIEEEARQLKLQKDEKNKLWEEVRKLKYMSYDKPSDGLSRVKEIREKAGKLSMGADFFQELDKLFNELNLAVITQKRKDIEILFKTGKITEQGVIEKLEELKKDEWVSKNPQVSKEIDAAIQDVNEQLERNAQAYWESLTGEISALILNKQFQEAYNKCLNFPSKFSGTKAFEAAKKYLDVILEQKKMYEESLKEKVSNRSNEEQTNTTTTTTTTLSSIEQNTEKEASNEKSSNGKALENSNKTTEENKEIILFDKSISKNWKEYWVQNEQGILVWSSIGDSLYGTLPPSTKTKPVNLSIIYYAKKTFLNFILQFKFKITQAVEAAEKGTFAVIAHYNKKDISTIAVPRARPTINEWLSATLTVAGNQGSLTIEKHGPGDFYTADTVKEGYIGFILFPGNSIYFKDIVIKPIKDINDIVSKNYSLIENNSLKGWEQAGFKIDWTIKDNIISAQNNAQVDSEADPSKYYAVLYYAKTPLDIDDFEISFKFRVERGGFGIFPKYNFSGSSWGGCNVPPEKYTSYTCTEYDKDAWFQARVSIKKDKAIVFLPCYNPYTVSGPAETKGYFAFLLQPGQKMFVKDIYIKFNR